MKLNLTSLPLAILVCLGALAATGERAQAQDASFGCKVLLCSASPTGWASIPYCVPVMEELFRILDKGGSWPSCPEGGQTSGVRYQPYLPCPDGTTAGSMSDGEWTPNANGNMCGKTKTQWASHKDGGPTSEVITTARPMRDKPYNVVITPTGGQPVTIWFSVSN